MQVTIYDERVFSSYTVPIENIHVEKPPNEEVSNIRQVVTTRINQKPVFSRKKK
jgi:hypothetical protein